jgi:hypothetical protein
MKSAAPPRNPTDATTMVAFISELIETHMEKCDNDLIPTAHVVSERNNSAASVAKLSNAGPMLTIALDDGTKWLLSLLKTA